MKPMKAFGVLAALGGLLVTLNLGGVAGCGDDNGAGGGGGGGGGGTTSDSVTTARLTTTAVSFASFANSDPAALIARTSQAGLKAQTGECVVTDTDISCPCEGGGSFNFDLGSSDESTITFDNCIDAAGGLIDGAITIVSESETAATIEFDNLTTDFGDCGAFTLNGSETIDGDTITIDASATGGGETINIDGELTSNSDGTVDGTLEYSGALEATCFFDNTDTSSCPAVAEACDFVEADVCVGEAYIDTCE